MNKNIALVKASAAIENNVQTLQKSLEEKNDAYVKCAHRVETMTSVSLTNIFFLFRDFNEFLLQQLRDLEALRKQQEETIFIRDKELQETNKELEERKRILDTITKLTRA